MHVNTIRVVRASNADEAVRQIERDLEMDESLTSDNYWSIVGVLNLNTDKYTPFERDSDFFSSRENIIKAVVEELASKERYEELKKKLDKEIKAEEWERARITVKDIDDIYYIVKHGFSFTKDKITELAPFKINTFSITDLTFGAKGDTFAVIINFHF